MEGAILFFLEIFWCLKLLQLQNIIYMTKKQSESGVGMGYTVVFKFGLNDFIVSSK